ncbi:MAG: lysophospholipid acyltransferase family protein [Hyphomicrobiaceae bacterium]|nr:lysophospholipid acyltransferase family protein [Hyphomicrobiaceae bacterium]
MGRLRATLILAAFLALTIPLMPVQALFARVRPSAARRFPYWYHRQVCRLLGIRLHVEGAITSGKPVLLVSNHTSWLDIPVLSAVAPVSFVAKREVGSWPFVSSLARLQRTVFVDRDRKSAAGQSANEIAERLGQGDTVVLFAEGTSSDGNRVLPFLTSLFGAAKPSAGSSVQPPLDAVVQTLSVVYTKLHGVPLGIADRPHVGWYGDMEMKAHAWALLQAGPLDVAICIGPPIPLADFADRKALARHCETEVRRNVVRMLRSAAPGEDIAVTVPLDTAVGRRLPAAATSSNWR